MECANSRVQRNPFLRTFLTDELLTGWLFNRHEYTTPSPPASRGGKLRILHKSQLFTIATNTNFCHL